MLWKSRLKNLSLDIQIQNILGLYVVLFLAYMNQHVLNTFYNNLEASNLLFSNKYYTLHIYSLGIPKTVFHPMFFTSILQWGLYLWWSLFIFSMFVSNSVLNNSPCLLQIITYLGFQRLVSVYSLMLIDVKQKTNLYQFYSSCINPQLIVLLGLPSFSPQYFKTSFKSPGY
jgi:hypothetical protein